MKPEYRPAMNHVEITALDIREPEWVVSCRIFTEKILETLDIDGWEVSLAFCSDEYIRSLNNTYRSIDGSTDVLSFPQEEGRQDQDSGPYIAGDIVISLDTLAENAEKFDISENEELKRLIIHGILHLCGMDHETNGPEENMLMLQEKLLRETGEDIF